MKLIIVLAAVLGTALAHKYCKNDDQCDPLGPDLICVKSMCAWGICGCPRGQAMKYVGSERLFRCVYIKKIGEGCSNEGDGGVCGAANSACINNVCTCNTNFVTSWGGENCLSSKHSYVGESCSAQGGQLDNSCSNGGAGGGGTCRVGTTWDDATLGNQAVNHPLDFVPNTCACPAGHQTTLPNAFDDAPWMGRKDPACAPIKVGDSCLRDSDCVSISGNAACTNEVCTCSDANEVADITGLYCGPAIGFGGTCFDAVAGNINTGVCDGSKGLRCGEVCNMASYAAGVTGSTLTCQCDPGWSAGGSSCSAVAEGAACNGDYNCKSLGVNAICTDGTCQNGGIRVVVSLIVMMLPLLSLILN